MQIEHSRKFRLSTGLLQIPILLLFGWGVCPSDTEASLNLEGTVFEQAGRKANIDPLLLYAVALCESGYHSDPSKGLVAPYPWVLRTPDGPVYGESRAEAERALHRALKKSKSVDVGLMQINVLWHGHRVRHPEDLLDVHINVSVAADILNERLKTNRNNWQQSLAQYHSFNVERGYWYATYVLGIYAQIANDVKGKVLVFHW